MSSNLRIGALLAALLALAPCARAQDVQAPRPVLGQQVSFTGGPIASKGTIVGGSGYTTGTYTNVPLTGATSGATGATATVIVSGGAVTSVFVGVASAPVTITGINAGYFAGESLTTSNANIGGTGSGFSVPVATINNWSWAVPASVNWICTTEVGGGGQGGGGYNSGGGAGGGGGGGTIGPICGPVTPGASLTITVGIGGWNAGAAGAAGSNGQVGGATLITGLSYPLATANGGAGGVAGAVANGGAGGNGTTASGSALGVSTGGAGGTAGAGTSGSIALGYGYMVSGTGGGGGASSAQSGNAASLANGWLNVRPTGGTGTAAGGPGGASVYGTGANGGNAGSGGIACTAGQWGGAGGGGAATEAGGFGCGGFVIIGWNG